MTYNIITVSFGALRKITGPALQWQYNQKQYLNINGLDLPEVYAVDFMNEGDSRTVTMAPTEEGVLIPDQFLSDGRPIIAYIVVIDGESVNTIAQITFPVNARGERTDMSPEPAEQQQIDSLIASLSDGVARSEEAAELLESPTAEATTLEPGSEASASYADGVFSFGIPKGDKGDKLVYDDLTEADKDDLVHGPILEAQTSAVAAVGDARTNAVNAVNQAGETQVEAVEDKGAEVIASIPADYTELSNAVFDDVTGLDTKAPVILETASGAIASFNDGADSMPIKKLVATIEPVQDLHGYANPWPAGGGANICDPLLKFTAGTYYGVTLSTTDGYNFTLSGTGTGSGNIQCPTIPTADCVVYPAGTYTSTGAIFATYKPDGSWYANRQVGTWTADSDFIVRSAYVQIVEGATPASGSRFLSLAKGSTTLTSWSPYSNICPISGWTGAEIYREAEYDADANPTISVTFPTEAGTVYGGTLDVTNGVLTVDRAMVDLGTISWSAHSSLSNVFTGNGSSLARWLIIPGTGKASAICSSYVLTTSASGGVDVVDCSIAFGTGGSTSIYVHDSTVSDLTEFINSISGVQVVYELTTPVAYQLTESEISGILTTLYGTNNIWASTGDTEVTYPADTKLYIDSKITQAIANALNS